MNIIEVKGLKKHFTINKREPGIKGVLKSMVRPEFILKKAVDGIDFNVSKGEIVGFIGPNGAGKSTTIKMLTGILVPSDGIVKVNGIVPYQNRRENSMHIGVVFGQRTQLWWNLPVRESFDLLRTIYKLPMHQFNDNIKLFSEILDIDKLLDIPVRQLSLGQRMRCEIVACLLHNPQIIYLDEPTIGLDIIAKERIRDFITQINQETKVTVILTTHDMSDIEKLCNRIVVIDKGTIIYDGTLEEVKSKYGKERVLIVDFEDNIDKLEVKSGTIIDTSATRKQILFNKDDISASDLVSDLSNKYRIKDFSLRETEIENIIKHIYESKEL